MFPANCLENKGYVADKEDEEEEAGDSNKKGKKVPAEEMDTAQIEKSRKGQSQGDGSGQVEPAVSDKVASVDELSMFQEVNDFLTDKEVDVETLMERRDNYIRLNEAPPAP